MDPIWGNVVLIIVILISFYLAFIRPNQVRDRKRRELLDALMVGDKVVTVGGLYGEIVKLTGDVAILKIAERVEVTIVRSAVKYLVDGEGLKKKH